jgi:hypothetical protein
MLKHEAVLFGASRHSGLLEVEFTRRNDIAVALPASCQRAYAAAMKR